MVVPPYASIHECPDVRAAVAAKSFNSGQEHFDRLGYREGRFPYPEFRLEMDA